MKKENLHLLRHIAETLLANAEDGAARCALILQLDQIRKAFASDPRIVSNLCDRSMPEEKRDAALRAALDGSMREDLVGALALLLRKNALRDIGGLTLAIERSILERGDMTVAELKAAEELDPSVPAAIAEMLKAKLNKDVILKTSVDPRLLGGFVLEVDNRTVDASARGALQELRQTLTP